MSDLMQHLIEQFGRDSIVSVDKKQPDDVPTVLISVQKRSKVTLLMTIGLSDYKMPVPDLYAERSYTELVFCLPSHWDLDDISNQWVYNWIQKLAKHVVEKQTWFGPGHTIPNGNPVSAISERMKQKYLILTDPIYLKSELSPITLEDRTVYFLAILPIFEDEMDYKMGKGTFKLLQKIEGKGISEMLDDYRMSSLKSKWRIFGK